MSPMSTSESEFRELAQNLAWLRVCAITGQILTIVGVVGVLRLPITPGTLCAGVAVLGGFALFVLWRLTRPWPVAASEVVVHFAVDIVVLTYLLYFTGGSANPFITLLVMPIALAATALPVRHVAVVTALAGLQNDRGLPQGKSEPRSHSFGSHPAKDHMFTCRVCDVI